MSDQEGGMADYEPGIDKPSWPARLDEANARVAALEAVIKQKTDQNGRLSAENAHLRYEAKGDAPNLSEKCAALEAETHQLRVLIAEVCHLVDPGDSKGAQALTFAQLADGLQQQCVVRVDDAEEEVARLEAENTCLRERLQAVVDAVDKTPSALKKTQQIARSLTDKAYSGDFVEAEIATTIPFQIRAMRKERKWTQAELASLTGQHQKTISDFENPDKGPPSIPSLCRIAAVFDVGLIVRFAPFSELVDWSVNMTKTAHFVPTRTKDARLRAQQEGKLMTCTGEELGQSYEPVSPAVPREEPK